MDSDDGEDSPTTPAKLVRLEMLLAAAREIPAFLGYKKQLLSNDWSSPSVHNRLLMTTYLLDRRRRSSGASNARC